MAAAPAIYEQVLISRGPRARGAVLKGMIPAYERKVSDLLGTVKVGSAEALEETAAATPADARMPRPKSTSAGEGARRYTSGFHG